MAIQVPKDIEFQNGNIFPITDLTEISNVWKVEEGTKKRKTYYKVYATIDGHGELTAFESNVYLEAEKFSKKWQEILKVYLEVAKSMASDVSTMAKPSADDENGTGGLGDPSLTRLFRIEYTDYNIIESQNEVYTLLNQMQEPSETFIEKCQDYADKHGCDLLVVYKERTKSGGHIQKYVMHMEVSQRAYMRKAAAEFVPSGSVCTKCGSPTCNAQFGCRKRNPTSAVFIVGDERRRHNLPVSDVEIWACGVVKRFGWAVELLDDNDRVVKRFDDIA